MSNLADDLTQPAPVRRKRLIVEGRAACVESIRDLLASHFAAASEAVEAAVVSAYRTGLDTMADINQPGVSAAEIGADLMPVKILPETQALAINGVIRLLLTARAEFALGVKRLDGNVLLPREEAVALSAVVEAALGLDTEKLFDGDLFETRP